MKKELTKVDFTNKEIFVGLDVLQKTWYATIIAGEVVISKSFIPDPEKLAKYLGKTYPGGNFKAAYEAGCFGYWIKEQLEANEIETLVINPADIPTTDKEKRTKTDKIDSKKIALGLKSGQLKGIFTPDRQMQEHRSLVRRRSDLTKKSTRLKNQIKSILKFYGIKYPEELENRSKHWSRNFLNWLSTVEFCSLQGQYKMDGSIRELKFIREEILIVTMQLRELSKTEPYIDKCKILRGIPGIGFLSSMILLTELPNIERFKSRDKFLSYIGLSPNEHSSGESRKIGHMTKRCNHRLRTMFIEASWIAIRKDPALTCFYNETFRRIGKQKAIIKVAKKLAARTRYLLINDSEYVIGVAA